MTGNKNDASSFSLAGARAIVRDLFVPDERIYWLDFLSTILLGHICCTITRLWFDWGIEPIWLRLLLGLTTFSVQCVCFYRAVMFIHEVVHLEDRRFVAFRVAWNLLCGIPFLMPSFTYYTHLDHHRRKLFGTEHDGEYLPLASMSPWCILLYLSQCLWAPPLVVLRFGVLTPLTWICPPLRRLIQQRLSSLVMDPSHLRPLPTAQALRAIRLQELACFVFLLACVLIPRVLWQRWAILLVIQAYLTGVVLVLMNCVRTLASHRWTSEGRAVTFVEQMLDSVTFDNDSLLAVILNPVGLRYHATHHLFPSMPYHQLSTAHRRLLTQLPADSPYRQTVEHSVWPVIVNLWRRAARQHKRQRPVGQTFLSAMDAGRQECLPHEDTAGPSLV